MATIHVANGGNLQTAINSAVLGDTITMEAGATFTGNFTLPLKSGSSYITIKSVAASGDLPPAGTRANPTYVPFMPTIRSGNTSPAFTSAKAAHHYRFECVNFGACLLGAGNVLLIGGDHGVGATIADANTDIQIDRCVARGEVVAGQLRFLYGGITRFQLTNSYLDRFGAQSQQSNILCMANGGGDHVIENNYFSGSTQCILYGGTGIVRTVASVTAATTSSVTLSDTTYLQAGWRIALLAEGGTRRRWPKCLSVNHGTRVAAIETLDVVPDLPGDARWGLVEKNVRIARNLFSHDPLVVLNGILQPTTGVGTSLISGSFAATTATFQVQARATGYTGLESRGAASAPTGSVTIGTNQGVRITWSAVTNAAGYYVYRTSGGVITRHTVSNVLTFDDVGTGGTVVTSVPGATLFVGWVAIEMKHGIDVHIDSNIFEWCYRGSFAGYPILIKCANQNGSASFLSTENVLVENCLSRHSNGACTVSGSETGVAFTMDIQPRPLQGLQFRNCLWYDTKTSNMALGGSGSGNYAFVISNSAKDVHLDHVTCMHESSGQFIIQSSTRGSPTGFSCTNSLFFGGAFFLLGDAAFGTAGLQAATGGLYTFTHNGISAPDTTSGRVTGTGVTYPAVATWRANFVDHDGPDIDDYALVGGSTFLGAGSDGEDLGCDIAALNTALTGVITGGAAAAPPPTILTTVVPSGQQGSVYAPVTLAASSGTLPYTWDITAGALPAGLTLSSAGVLSGTPTASGTFNFTARVQGGGSDTQAYVLVIAAAVSTPQILTPDVPNAVIGVAYNTTLLATQGQTPYTWSVVNGALPAGLTLNTATGAITGTPTAIGTSTFTVVVEDALAASSASRAFAIIVVDAIETLQAGRPQSWNGHEAKIFRRLDPPTFADQVESGDIWIRRAPASPVGFIAERQGTNIIWLQWPSNEARVREIASEVFATERGPDLSTVTMLAEYAGVAASPPAGDQEYANTARTRQLVDLTLATEVRLMVRVLANNSNPTARLHVKYAHESDPAAWTTLHADLSVPINAEGNWWTDWLPLPEDAMAQDVWLSARTISGSTQVLNLVAITVSFR